jgi:hypothetical protein
MTLPWVVSPAVRWHPLLFAAIALVIVVMMVVVVAVVIVM